MVEVEVEDVEDVVMLEVEDLLRRPQSVIRLAEREADKNSPASHEPGVVRCGVV